MLRPRFLVASVLSVLLVGVCPPVRAERSNDEPEIGASRTEWRQRLESRRGAALVDPLVGDSRSPDELVPVLALRSEPDERGWNRTERSLAWSYVALSLADVYQTTQIPDHGREANPFVSSWAGSQPDDAEIVLFKAAATWGLLHITKRYVRKGQRRKQVLSMLNTLQMGVVVHNESVRRDDFGGSGPGGL